MSDPTHAEIKRQQEEAEFNELFGFGPADGSPAPTFSLDGIEGLHQMGIQGEATARPATNAEKFLHVYADVNGLPYGFLHNEGASLEDVCDQIDPNWRRYFGGGWE